MDMTMSATVTVTGEPSISTNVYRCLPQMYWLGPHGAFGSGCRPRYHDQMRSMFAWCIKKNRVQGGVTQRAHVSVLAKPRAYPVVSIVVAGNARELPFRRLRELAIPAAQLC